MKLIELFESITVRREANSESFMDDLVLYDGKNKIGTSAVFKDRYGSSPAFNILFFGIDRAYRGKGLAEQGLLAVKRFMLRKDPAAKFVIAEVMSQKMLKTSIKVFGKPIYVSDEIKKYSLEDAFSMLPLDSTEDETGDVMGRKIYTVYKLKN